MLVSRSVGIFGVKIYNRDLVRGVFGHGSRRPIEFCRKNSIEVSSLKNVGVGTMGYALGPLGLAGCGGG